jgi:hypothetical protein
MGDIYSGQKDAKWRAEELRARNDKAFRDYEKRREAEDSNLQDKADWNRMKADIERLTKDRDEARRIVTYIRDTLTCQTAMRCQRCELTAIIRNWGDE